MRELDAEACDLMAEIILEDVEHPNLRKLLEHVIREGDFQRACILKEMHMGSRAATTPDGCRCNAPSLD